MTIEEDKALAARILKEEKESIDKINANNEELERLVRHIDECNKDLEFLKRCSLFGFLWWKLKKIYNTDKG